MGFVANGFDARTADEGRSAFSAQDGKTCVGEALFNQRLNLYSDPKHMDLPAAPATDEGIPATRLSLVGRGRWAHVRRLAMTLKPRAVAVVSVVSIAIATTSAFQTKRPASLLLDRAYMNDVRARGEKGDATIKAAIATLEDDAKKALAIQPMSVMDKTITPPSGDKHDYMSQAPYWWPDPSKPDGKPYIRKDGERNPEISRITDRDNLGRLGGAVTTLSLAYAYTGREEYATHAARLMRVWFLDPATRMNPHLEFGQYIPGINQGRGIGIIETRSLPDMLDAIMLISSSPAWTKADEDGLQAWMRAYLSWLVESTHGQEESRNGNNHETWYDVQVAGLALYTEQVDVARRTLEGSRARIGRQIASDGRQPRELERTRSWDYSEFNIAAFMDLATLGRHAGIDLWNYRTADGRSIRQALDFMVPYAAGERKWTFDQITTFRAETIHRILRRGAVAWKEPKYKALADKIGGGGPRLILTSP